MPAILQIVSKARLEMVVCFYYHSTLINVFTYIA